MKQNIIVVDSVKNLSDYDLSDLILTSIAEKTSYTYTALEALSIPYKYIGLNDIYHTCLKELFIPTKKLPDEKNKSYKRNILSKYKEALKISQRVQRNKNNNMSIEGHRQSISKDNTVYLIGEDITLFDALQEGDRRISSAVKYAIHPNRYDSLSNYGTTEVVKRKLLTKNKT